MLSQTANNGLTNRLAAYGITVEAVSITNFNSAILRTSDRVTVVQQAQNQLQTIKIQAQQAVTTANGTARSIELINNATLHSPHYLQYLALQKWNLSR
jgi:hypothetical protein